MLGFRRSKCIYGVRDPSELKGRGAMEIKFYLMDEHGPPSEGVGGTHHEVPKNNDSTVSTVHECLEINSFQTSGLLYR